MRIAPYEFGAWPVEIVGGGGITINVNVANSSSSAEEIAAVISSELRMQGLA